MDADATSEAVLAAVRNTLGDTGQIPTGIVVVASVIDEDGDAAVWVADDGTAWTTLGLLEFAGAQLRANATRCDCDDCNP